MRNLVRFGLCLAWPSLMLPAPAADTLVAGSYARACADQAQLAENSLPVATNAIKICNQALTDEFLITADLAATYVNRGVIALGSTPADAERDFRRAIALAPTAGDAYVDLGASEIGQNRFDEAIADIDHGMRLTMREAEKAYFNRAVAEDDKGNETAAYRDFRTALALRPGWPQAVAELARFTVVTR